MNERIAHPLTVDPAAYDTDAVAWSVAQAEHLRARRFDQVDWAHVIEEIESLGNGLRTQLYSRMSGLIEHLIKLEVSRLADPRRQWILSVAEQRRRIARLVAKNPSLRAELETAFAEEWAAGAAMARAGLEDFDAELIPDAPSFTLADALDPDFIPEQ